MKTTKTEELKNAIAELEEDHENLNAVVDGWSRMRERHLASYNTALEEAKNDLSIDADILHTVAALRGKKFKASDEEYNLAVKTRSKTIHTLEGLKECLRTGRDPITLLSQIPGGDLGFGGAKPNVGEWLDDLGLGLPNIKNPKKPSGSEGEN